VFTNKNISENKIACYHCGDICNNHSLHIDQKYFCCYGCKSVFQILNENDLCTYYTLNQNPGTEQKVEIRKDKFAFLDNDDIIAKLLQFRSANKSQLTFYIPQIHCSSCLWLLENLHTIDNGIIESRVNFNVKEVFISFENNQTSLRKVVELLSKLGYEPHLSLNEISDKQLHKIDRTRWYKIGIAGFCFGNIMMMSFADYFAIINTVEPAIKYFFSFMSVVLSLPVLFYSANEFFISAWNGLKNKFLNIDFPIALALVITFSRSIYEIVSQTGTGYLDSMTGIVFFMLIGRWLQSRTYQSISFDRDYKSFFPIALNVIKEGFIKPTEIIEVKKNDLIQVYSNEIIPVDTILIKGQAKIDYSFVSGESEPVTIQVGEMIYAGGKQLGGLLELLVFKEVSQSYLTNLWNNPIFDKKQISKKSIYDIIGKYFTYLVLAIGALSGLFWYWMGSPTLMWNAFTTILIVACPCALLLSENYTNGNIIRILAKNKFYLKSAEVLTKIAQINHIVFDKTGTITQANSSRTKYAGKVLNEEMKMLIASLVKQSAHPASRLIFDYLNVPTTLDVYHFKEQEGKGIDAWIQEHHIKIGSERFIGGAHSYEDKGAKVVIYIDGEIVGNFIITNKYRLGVSNLLVSLKKHFTLSLLSGDNDAEAKNVEALLGKDSKILFNQSPTQKLEYIKYLQNALHQEVMMIGDGLNDAGALKQSTVGIAVADAKNSFTPSSDAIIDANKLIDMDKFIQFIRQGKNIILFTFSISAIYNIIGLYFAVQGTLSPVVAAILMPCSAISIILLTYGLTEIMANYFKLNRS